MDKELTEIAPKNLDGSDVVVNTVQRASEEEVKKAAEEEKAKKQDYYVDPLEQDALMKEKLAKIEEDKKTLAEDNENSESAKSPASDDDTIRPDTNVTGYFSTGATAKKENFLTRPASKRTLLLCFIFSIINGIYAVIFLALSVASSFTLHWFLNYLYAVVTVISLVILFNCIRSRKIQNNSLRRYALVGIIGSIIALSPTIAWLIHWIMSIA